MTKKINTTTKASRELTVQAIEKEINPMLEKAKTLTIKNTEDMHVATEYLSQLNLAKDKVTERMETITKPAKEVIKGAEAVWKPFITMAKGAIEMVREKMSDYQTQEVMRAREEETKIASRVGDGKGKFKVETAVQKIDEIEKPLENVQTQSGAVGFRESEQFEIEDVSKIPLEYMLPNEVKIRSAMKAGIKLDGVRYFKKMIPINSR